MVTLHLKVFGYKSAFVASSNIDSRLFLLVLLQVLAKDTV